ncbi:crotonase/enoyl-CoA hydratase family protein [Nocardioides sp. QY071]|uniref:crotonase/enoyl-CoA hydratase family protein n=1 Tax=Nocardioides sp. QY071 TaxID=3044187 RepID=UPI00249CA33F|nr:crotonase/enoyl-CoA hydratase family protein [Nocardioides sp. QY071]WGY00460.1 crotonase/enoyl-CoA hydratase family protein [Nocardioides sp. QY071]
MADLIATVTLLKRGPTPSMGAAHFEELPLVFSGLEARDDVRVIVIRGAGDHFSFGLDLVDMRPLLDLARPGANAADRQALLRRIADLQAAFTRVAATTKPVVAAVDGWCIGAGLDLISAADLRIATQGARFSIRETRMAMVADLGSLQRLVGIIGDGHLRELALTGRDFTAADGLQIGLLNRVVTDVGALHATTMELAKELAHNSPLVLSGVKRVLSEQRESRVRAGLELVAAWNAAFMPSDDLLEALNAFAERRRAEFSGR